MEPFPLIPQIQNTVIPEMGYLVREVFQNAFQAETAAWRISINLSKSCQQNEDLRQIAAKIKMEMGDHKGTLDDLEQAELQIMQSQGYHLCRNQGIISNEKAIELLRLKRHPLYIDLHPNILKKYPLLQSDDLLPAMHERRTDFRLDEKARIKMKNRLCRSRDSLLDEVAIQNITSRACRFDNVAERKLRRTKLRDRLTINQTATRKRSIIRTECSRTILVAEPEELLFHNFKYGKLYKKTLLIKNVSNSMARYKIERRSPHSKFTISYDAEAIETTKIAPGMHVKLTVSFLCNVIEDPEEFLLVNVPSGKTVCVRMCGYRDPPILRGVYPISLTYTESVIMDTESSSSLFYSISEVETGAEKKRNQRKVDLGANFDCGQCFVGERVVIITRFVNDGGDGRFFIMSEIDWCSLNIDDIMDCNMIFIPPFAVWPIYFTLQPGEYIEIRTYFYPESYGTQVDKLYILCDNHGMSTIEVIGDGILYDPNFLRFSGNIEKLSSDEQVNDSAAHYCLNIRHCESDIEMIENLILITNTSGLEIYYLWEKSAANNCNSDQIQLPIEDLDIRPASGSLHPKSTTTFRIIVRVKDLEPSDYRAFLRFYVEDIPLAAVPRDCDLKTKDSCKNQRDCTTTVDIVVADIQIWVDCVPRFSKLSANLDVNEKIQRETFRCSAEPEITDCINNDYSSLGSTTATPDLDEESSVTFDHLLICGLENQRCQEYFTGVENPINPRSICFGLIENLDVSISRPVITRLDVHPLTPNTATLVPGRPLYVGIEQVYTLTLRNLICKPLSYAWGQPLTNDGCKLKVKCNPDKGLIAPTGTTKIEVTCLPMDTGKIENFFIPCFIEGHQLPITLGITCTIDAFYVTFIFLPISDGILSPTDNSVRVEWHKSGHTSALNLNNLIMDRNCKITEEQEIKNIDLDVGRVVVTTAVGPALQDIENVSLQLTLPKTSSTGNQQAKARSKSDTTPNLKSNATVEKLQEIEPFGLRSWESLLDGIIWTENEPDEFISLTKPQAVVPFYKTIVPPITQSLAIEFIDLPLRTVRKRTFVIRNETPAKSTFQIILKQFGPLKTIKELNPEETIDVTYANVMGHASETYWEKIKPPGQSIVLVIEPTSGTLASHETVPIDIYVYADTWGIYVDEITVAIVGLPDYVFGVCTQVIGSPISYPVCRSGINKTPILRFGAADFVADSITRKIVIENTSSIVLTVNWYSYLIYSPPAQGAIPFNVILQMFSPLTNKIVNMESGGSKTGEKISTASSGKEESQQSRLNIHDSTITKTNSFISNCHQIENDTSTLNQAWSNCYSESIISSEKISSRNETRTATDSFKTDFLNDEYGEYSTESETNSVFNISEQTDEKETELELALTPYYGVPDYSMFTVSPAQLLIPVKEKRWIEVTFHKASDKYGIENCLTEVHGRLMGFIRVAPMHKYKAECFSRDDGIMLAPTEIELRVTAVEPEKSIAPLKTSPSVPDYMENSINEAYRNWDNEDFTCDP